MKLSVSDCYARRGLELKPHGAGERGPEFVGPCPGCGGKDRFIIWPDQNGGTGSYHCRAGGNGCGRSGDVIQFLRDFEGLTFAEAKRAAGMEASLCAPRSSPRMPKRTEKDGMRETPAADAPALWRQKAANFASVCHEQLLANPEQLAWLERRGLPLEAVKRFRLGWNGCDGETHINRPRKIWGLPDAPPRKDGEKPRKSLWLPRGLVIPAWGADGLAHRLRIRRTDEDRAATGLDLKFYVVPGSGMAPLFIPQSPGLLPPSSCAVLVESELDAMALSHAAGDLAAALALMTAKVRGLPSETMHALRSSAVILTATDVGDADGAGAKGALLVAATFPQARRWPCVGGKDPGQMACAGASLRAWVLAGLPDSLVAIAAGKGVIATEAEHRPEPRKGLPALDLASEPHSGDILPSALPPEAYGAEPADRLTRPIGPRDCLKILARAGIVPRVADDDFVYEGHERWSAADTVRLLRWSRLYGEWVREALCGDAAEERSMDVGQNRGAAL